MNGKGTEWGVTAKLTPAGWQPIETAPKNGTWILLYDPAGLVDELEDRTQFAVGRWVRPFRFDSECWCVACLQGGYDCIIAKPTHWKPLEPPDGE